MERRVGFPDGSAPAAVKFLLDLHPADALPPEIAASGASDDAPPAAAPAALPAPTMPVDACAEKSAVRVRAVPELGGKGLPLREPAPCTPDAVRSAA
jgi:hypothetical protein